LARNIEILKKRKIKKILFAGGNLKEFEFSKITVGNYCKKI
jgi:hypothetical protein